PAERATPPPRRSSLQETPLPSPVPYHVADPTSGAQRVSPSELVAPARDDEDETKPGERPPPRRTGLAEAARRISGMISGHEARAMPVDLAAELDTRQRPRIAAEALHKIAQPPPTVPVERIDPDDVVTPAIAQQAVPRDSEEELTQPRERPLTGDDEEPT